MTEKLLTEWSRIKPNKNKFSRYMCLCIYRSKRRQILKTRHWVQLDGCSKTRHVQLLILNQISSFKSLYPCMLIRCVICLQDPAMW